MISGQDIKDFKDVDCTVARRLANDMRQPFPSAMVFHDAMEYFERVINELEKLQKEKS